MVDGELRILWSNAPAQTLIGGSLEIETRRGVLSTVDRARQAALRVFILGAGALRSVWSLPQADGSGSLLMTSVRAGKGDRFGITLRRAGPDYRSYYRELDKAFSLTATEHRVLLLLLAGNEAETVAQLNGVTIATTRSHIRGIYLKLGVNSRERLFALAQAFQI